MKSAITAIGTAVPPYRQAQMKAAEIVASALQLKTKEERLLKSIYRKTGIDYRHSVMADFLKKPGEHDFFPNDLSQPFPSTAKRMQVYKQSALPLAIDAVNDLFKQVSEFNPNNITHLITVSCTGMYAPGLDIELAAHFSLSPNIARTAVNFMGCYGAFNGLKLADAICRADHTAKVLVVSVELCTLHFQKNESLDNIFANAIFADGAAAVLVESETQAKSLIFESFHCDLLPQHAKEMAWAISDQGFDIVLSSYVPAAIETGIGQFVERLLAKTECRFSDIDLFAIHPGGYKILTACEKALGISSDQNRFAYEVLRNYGNMSSATVLFVLKAIWHELDTLPQAKNIFSCAFGPGLTLESMLLSVK